jgi:uncharacterized protein (DUF1684 family)
MLLLCASVAVLLAVDPSGYVQQIEKWRAQREARLKADDGWLTVAGLFWLQEGANSIGSSDGDRIVLPKGSSPAHVGRIDFKAGKATLQLDPGVPGKVNGKNMRTAELRSDAETDGKPDIVTLGDVSFFIIKRGERFGVRLKDKNSEFRRKFRGLTWYAIKPAWRIEAKWVPYSQPKKIVFDSMTGDKQQEMSPGYAVFHIEGKEYRLEPTSEGDQLFFVFRDKTAGKTTYPAARFIYSDLPANGGVIIDFNKAYNPPCAFTRYATCPLPTVQNRLPIEVPAGEMKYKGGTH